MRGKCVSVMETATIIHLPLKSTGVAGGEAEFSVTGTVEPVH